MTGDIEKKDKIEDNKKELDLEDLKKKLEECQKLKDEYLASWQRERADFLNYKKDETKRIESFFKYAGQELILKILPILDNFDVAEKKLPEELKKNENVKGILQIKKQVLDFLKNLGMEPIDCLGKKFDPNFMEATGEVEAKPAFAPASAEATAGKEAVADKESGIVIEEIQKGYKIQGKLLRVAKVKVTK